MILVNIEDINFSALLRCDELNLSDLGLIFTFPYENNLINVPLAPLSYSTWLEYYLTAAQNKNYPWNTSYKPQGSEFTYSYIGNITRLENISGEELLYNFEIHGDYYFEYNETNNVFFIDRFKNLYENLSNYLGQFSHSRYYGSQKYRILFGFFDWNSINYNHFFLLDNTGQIKVGVFEFYWATTN